MPSSLGGDIIELSENATIPAALETVETAKHKNRKQVILEEIKSQGSSAEKIGTLISSQEKFKIDAKYED